MSLNDDALVKHLVVDMSAFRKRARGTLMRISRATYTVSGVLAEIRDEETREFVAGLPFQLIVQEPTPASLKIVTEISKITGDYPSLSAVDLRVMALAHDLHLQHCCRDSINYDVKRLAVRESTTRRPESPDLEACLGAVRLNSERNSARKTEPRVSGGSSTNDEDGQSSASSAELKIDGNDVENSGNDDDGEGEWITQDNFDDALIKYDSGLARPATDESATDGVLEVACLTTDFSIQNVLMHMKMKVLSVGGLLIKRLNSYIMRCRSCYHTTSVMDKEFCPRCGYKSLHRVAVTVGADGTLHLHLNPERLRVTRGLKHSVALPKGGKHDDQEKMFADQRMPQNRSAKMNSRTKTDAPFVLHDVFSRAAHLGIRPLADGGGRSRRRNPNESRGGRRKK